jgi:hypothetical protein
MVNMIPIYIVDVSITHPSGVSDRAAAATTDGAAAAASPGAAVPTVDVAMVPVRLPLIARVLCRNLLHCVK